MRQGIYLLSVPHNLSLPTTSLFVDPSSSFAFLQIPRPRLDNTRSARTLHIETTTMYKSLITVALAGMASAAVAPSGYDNASSSSSIAAPTGYVSSELAPSSYPTTSASVCNPSTPYTSTLIYRSTTLYSTIYPSGATGSSAPATGSAAPYPVPSGNATVPIMSTGVPTASTPGSTSGSTSEPNASTSGSAAQQTANAAVVAKPVGALLGLAGLAAAFL